MTEREPFAFVRHETTVFIGNRFIADFDFKEDADFAAKEINAAFDARVNEAEKKAVEEFRERAVEEIFNHPCGVSMYASSREAYAAQEMRDRMQELVESLPAEGKP